MTRYIGASRASYELAQPIGDGGEAQVFGVSGRSDLVAKLYTQDRPGYERKLALMVANPPREPQAGHRTVAWPLDVLLDGRNRCAGYIMPRVPDAVLLLRVFNPKLRAQVLPGFSLRYLYRTALNLATAFSVVHDRGYVVGCDYPIRRHWPLGLAIQREQAG